MWAKPTFRSRENPLVEGWESSVKMMRGGRNASGVSVCSRIAISRMHLEIVVGRNRSSARTWAHIIGRTQRVLSGSPSGEFVRAPCWTCVFILLRYNQYRGWTQRWHNTTFGDNWLFFEIATNYCLLPDISQLADGAQGVHHIRANQKFNKQRINGQIGLNLIKTFFYWFNNKLIYNTILSFNTHIL